jgi:hypothetical protein
MVRVEMGVGLLLTLGFLCVPAVGACGCTKASPYQKPGDMIWGATCPYDKTTQRQIWVESAQKYVPLSDRASRLGNQLVGFVGLAPTSARFEQLAPLLEEYPEVREGLIALPTAHTAESSHLKGAVASMLRDLEVLVNAAIAPYLRGGSVPDEAGRQRASDAQLDLLISQRLANEALLQGLSQHGLTVRDALREPPPTIMPTWAAK